MKTFHRIVIELEKFYGTPRPQLSDPLQLILWENIGYLVDDDKRATAFECLRKEVGLRPTDILSAPAAKLLEIASLGGIHPEIRAQRLKEIAHIVLNDFDGDLSQALSLPPQKANKALKKFPSIGDPGTDKILLFSASYAVLALESNGLRVLLRLGFGKEQKSYSASYRSVKESLAQQIGSDIDFLIRAYELLRRHGKELCRRNAPRCEKCPLRGDCDYYQRSATFQRL